MKLRASVIWFVVIIAVLIALGFWLGNRRPEVPVASLIETNAAPFGTTTPGQRLSTSAHTATPPAQVAANAGAPPMIDKGQQIKEGLDSMNDVPIVFYGRLRDQFDNPVVGAEIAGSVIIYNGVQAGSEKIVVTSDANGYFQINHGSGESLGIMPKKAGYALATTGTEFRYSHLDQHPYIPDARNPTVVKMWKLQGGEHLINFNLETYIPTDGTPLFYDLQSCQQMESQGDISFSLQCPIKPNLREEYDWQVAINMINGGINESSGLGLEKMYQAPDFGYASEWTKSFSKQTTLWTSRFNGDFYFTSRGGKYYGKLWLEIDTDVVKNGTALATIRGYLNPAGSRNLEIDPSMVTGVHP